MTVNLSLGHTQGIIAAARAAGLTTPQTAYVLATAFWETNRTMLPVEEAYYLGARADAYRQRLRYYPWHGRGFVQLTWRDNYVRAGLELDLDMTTDPRVAMDADIAAQVLVVGSRDGWFTGRRLVDYINATATDYRGARRIINGTDKAAQIAALADQYEDALTPEPDYPFLRRGARGAAVGQLQALLIAAGHALDADGIFGPATAAAVRKFQSDRGLTPDGICGPITWAALTTEN